MFSNGKTPDRFGRLWPKGTELCDECGQPDNCGECNHIPLSQGEVIALGGRQSDWVLPPPPSIPPVTSHKPEETEFEKARRLTLEQGQPVVPFYIFQTIGEDRRNGRICEIVARTGLDPYGEEPTFKVVFNNGESEICLSSELHPWYPAR